MNAEQGSSMNVGWFFGLYFDIDMRKKSLCDVNIILKMVEITADKF